MTSPAEMQATYDDLTLARMVFQRTQNRNADQPLITFVSYDDQNAEQIETRSYAQLWEKACEFAGWASAQGLRRGDRIALMMQNHPEFVDALVGAAVLGAIVVPIDPRTRGDKLQYQISQAGCRGVAIAGYCLDQWRDVQAGVPGVDWTLVLEPPATSLPLGPGEHAWRSLPPAAPCPEAELPSDLSECQQLLYTSGTTGNPKAIVGTYAKFAVQGRRLVEHFGLRVSDRMYTGLSLTHANALLISLAGCLYSGIPLVISRKFTQSRLWETIGRHRCTTLNLLGGMFTHIFAMPPKDGEADNPLRMVISAGMPRAIWPDFSRRFGVEITEFYGSAEGGSTVNRSGEGPVGSCGKPARGLEMMILDDQDQPCPPGVPGEIVFRNIDGSPMTVTYFGNPEASAAKTRSGWLRMGDIGYVDQDGWLFFMHRKGHGIRRNGEFIATAYIEKEIAKYPGVNDVFVYGVDSGNAGEKDIVAALVLGNASTFEPGQLMDALSGTLERSHLPSYLHLVGAIPKTASEKPLERILQQEFASGRATVLALQQGAAG